MDEVVEVVEPIEAEIVETLDIKSLNVFQRLQLVQLELKAPKSQFNKFGNYAYRNCEDILESLKPLLNKYRLCIKIDDMVEKVDTRFYLIATVKLYNIDNPTDWVENTAYAREEEAKKGMDGSQITGASSSYARKYALNGLFAIDDTRDSDTTNTQGKEQEQANKKQQSQSNKNDDFTKEKAFSLFNSLDEDKQNKLLAYYKVSNHIELNDKQLREIYMKLNKTKG